MNKTILTTLLILALSPSFATACPSVYSYGFSAGCGSKLSVLPNGHIGYNGCPEAGDPYKDEGPIEKVYKDRHGSDWPGLDSWLECQLAARKGNSAPKKGDSQASRQIRDCPPTLPASCVTWSLYDRQLNWWTVKNGCSKDAKVMFKGDSGTPEDTPVFGPGESTRVTWRGSLEPAYLVWDAQASIRFYREKSAGAALQCRRNLPF